MKTIFIILLFWFLLSVPAWLNNHKRDRKIQQIRRERAADKHDLELEKLRIKEEFRHQRELEKEHARRFIAIEKEQARQAEELIKHEKRISALEKTISQAQYDLDIEYENLDHYAKKLEALDEDLEHAKWEVENWTMQRLVDKTSAAKKNVEKIEDQIFSWEDKVRKAEKRLDKAKRTRDAAQRELEAA